MAFATADERYFVSLINQVRKNKNLSALKIEQSLNSSADEHSQWMLNADVFSHTGQSGSSATDRMKAAGFDFSGGWMAAENIAYVSVDNDGSYRDEIQTLHNMLMGSPGHYANIVNTSASLIGLGLKVGDFAGYKVLMVTQNFADTDGQVNIQGGSKGFASVSAPSVSTAMESRADWLDGLNGKVFTGNATGTHRDDDFRLGAANNKAFGAGGDDWMMGRAGNDSLNGGSGNDRQMGMAGNDLLHGANGNDSLLGHAGADRLLGQNGHDLLRGGDGGDVLSGGGKNDRLFGDAGNDRLAGDAGNDWTHGGGGTDTLFGGLGNDTLDGGVGNDALNGGGGSDTFIFHRGGDRDTINGFTDDTDRLLIDKALLGNNSTTFVNNKITDTASGVVIKFGNGDVLVVNGPNLDPDDIVDDIFAI